jgi:hypothetical protein
MSKGDNKQISKRIQIINFIDALDSKKLFASHIGQNVLETISSNESRYGGGNSPNFLLKHS